MIKANYSCRSNYIYYFYNFWKINFNYIKLKIRKPISEYDCNARG